MCKIFCHKVNPAVITVTQLMTIQSVLITILSSIGLWHFFQGQPSNATPPRFIRLVSPSEPAIQAFYVLRPDRRPIPSVLHSYRIKKPFHRQSSYVLQRDLGAKCPTTGEFYVRVEWVSSKSRQIPPTALWGWHVHKHKLQISLEITNTDGHILRHLSLHPNAKESFWEGTV